jgi:hypothetical protein
MLYGFNIMSFVRICAGVFETQSPVQDVLGIFEKNIQT